MIVRDTDSIAQLRKDLRSYLRTVVRRDRAKEKYEALRSEAAQLNDQLARRMALQHVESLGLTSGDTKVTFFVSALEHVGCAQPLQSKLCAFMREAGYGDLVQESISHQTLGAWWRDRVGVLEPGENRDLRVQLRERCGVVFHVETRLGHRRVRLARLAGNLRGSG